LKVKISAIQGVYFLTTGIWPLVHVESFQAITGRKTDNWSGSEIDHWLLNTISVLIVAIGLTLLTAAVRRNVSAEIAVLAIASSLGLTAIDVFYVSRGIILPVYLVDAIAEVALIVLWCIAVTRSFRDI